MTQLKITYPGPGAIVTSPFVACGTVSRPSTPVTAIVTSKKTQQTFNRIQVNPPPGADWAFLFQVPEDEYALTASGPHTSDSVDPVTVVKAYMKISPIVQPDIPAPIHYPTAGSIVTNPFVAYGTVNPPTAPVTAYLTSDTTQQTFNGTPVNPPLGENWAFSFDVPDDTYCVTAKGGGTNDSVDPVTVVHHL